MYVYFRVLAVLTVDVLRVDFTHFRFLSFGFGCSWGLGFEGFGVLFFLGLRNFVQ